MARARSWIVAILVGLALPGAAMGPVRASDDGACFSIFGASGPVGELALARVAPGRERVSFVRNRDKASPSCPSGGEACRSRAFLVGGDEVVIAKGAGPFVCASFKSTKGAETSGWLPLADLDVFERRAAVRASDVAGLWRRDSEAQIRLSFEGGRVSVNGEATYGTLDPDRVRRGAVNIGTLEGPARLTRDVVAIGENYDGSKPAAGMDRAECFARLHLLGRYAVVEDNLGCGGMNVSFTGLYLRVLK
ncbi:MAG: hypothetical protein Q7T73_22430 [Beijerinckiaceae bacterium]|nr:hypothetical protein [Beijerinckiaceae bacterium]